MTNAEKDEIDIQKLTGAIVWRKKGEHLARMHEVARWLAEGNGQVCDSRGGDVVSRDCFVSDGIKYQIFESFDFCGTLVIKKWEDSQWHEPTLEYINTGRRPSGTIPPKEEA